MRIGVPREVKNHEYRIALTPAGAHELTRAGHSVLVETGAGLGSSITDDDFVSAGAEIVATADEVWAAADLLLKVKEPIEPEYPRLRRDQVLFTYLHLAASRPCTEALLAAGTTAIAYETVRLPDGSLPLLAPMSEVAGRLAPQAGANALHAGQRRARGAPGRRARGPARGTWWSSGPGWPARTRSRWPSAWVRTSRSSTSTSASCAASTSRYAGRVRTLVSTSHELERACPRRRPGDRGGPRARAPARRAW